MANHGIGLSMGDLGCVPWRYFKTAPRWLYTTPITLYLRRHTLWWYRYHYVAPCSLAVQSRWWRPVMECRLPATYFSVYGCVFGLWGFFLHVFLSGSACVYDIWLGFLILKWEVYRIEWILFWQIWKFALQKLIIVQILFWANLSYVAHEI